MLTKDDIDNLFKKRKDEILDNIEKFKDNFVIMPAGAKAVRLYEMLNELGIRPKFFVDNSKEKQGTKICGSKVEIISFEDYLKLENRPVVILSTCANHLEQIKTLLELHNVSYFVNSFISFDAHSMTDTSNVLLQKFSNYVDLYNSLEDTASKEVLDSLLRYRLNFDENELKNVYNPSCIQYFESNIYKITSSDSFVDCGAFDGDTLATVLRLTNEKLRNYYAFEPDKENYNELKNKAIKYQLPGSIYQLGCWSAKTQLTFADSGTTSSQITESGSIKVDVTSLDIELKDKDVTYIKMDIEGAEIEALKGAKNIIQNQKPVLAICVYHKFNDIFDIPELIKSFGVSYKYYLRHYTQDMRETVFYAVPV